MEMNLDRPYLSVLIPTKNRAHLVGYAIESVLQQELKDFEIIVCDNDDDASATKIVVDPFLNDRRVKYVRTGGFNMVDNWNRALKEADGQYVTVLEDKMIFYPGALLTIKNKLEKSPEGVVVWQTDTIEDNRSPARVIQLKPGQDEVLSSNSLLGMVTTDVMRYWYLLPRALSCVIPKTLIDNIVVNTDVDFYEPLAPDFVAAIKVLANVDEVLIVNQSLTLISSNKLSNGMQVSLRKSDNLKYYGGPSGIQVSTKFVPVKTQQIVANIVVNDYRSLADKYGGKLLKHEILNKNYVKMMTRELVKSTRQSKRIIWSRKEIEQLIMSDRQPFRNLMYMMSYVIKLGLDFSLRKMKSERQVRQFSVMDVEDSVQRNMEKYIPMNNVSTDVIDEKNIDR